MQNKLEFHRYDLAAFAAFTAYALCSLSIPLAIVKMGIELDFPLADGGMSQGGALHMIRSMAIVVTLLLCGSIAGRIGKRLSMGGSMVLMGTGILLCAFAVDFSIGPVSVKAYWMLWPLLAIAGFGEGICEGMATPFVQDLHPDAPERYVNIAHSFWSVGIVLCVLLTGGLLTLGVSWRIVLGGCGVLALASSLPFLWREAAGHHYPESSEKEDMAEILRKTGQIFRTPRFWWYSFGMFMGAGSEFCLTFWAAAFLELEFGATAFVASLGTGAIALGMFVGRTGFGYIAKRNNLPWILVGASLAMVPLSLALAGLTPAILPARWMLMTVLFILLFLSGIGIAPFWPTLQVHGVNNLPELDSTLLYIYFSAAGIPGCGFFTWFIGFLGDRLGGLRGALLLIPTSVFVYALIIILEHWCFKNKRELPSE